ncbi:MAG: response regulator transcription factor [Sulfuricurvum sp.]
MTLKLIREYSKDFNILYVEDDEKLLNTTKELFENYFKTVDVASNGTQALEAYIHYKEVNGYTYDLLISDINMPQMNGIELSRNVLMHNPDQSIIIISAHNDSNYLLDAIDMGVSGFIIKPIRHERLNAILYKISMAIYDHKYVQNHLKILEELNLELESKNAKLEKSLRLLDTNNNKQELFNSLKKPQNKELSSEINKDIFREQIDDFIRNDIFELKELLNEIDLLVIDIVEKREALDIKAQLRLVSLFKKYATTLSMYTFFDELSVAMSLFIATLEENPLPENEEHIKNVFSLLESFLYDLYRWHEDLLSGDESKINAFDASNIVNMRLITNMWRASEEEGESNVDAIFDF